VDRVGGRGWFGRGEEQDAAVVGEAEAGGERDLHERGCAARHVDANLFGCAGGEFAAERLRCTRRVGAGDRPDAEEAAVAVRAGFAVAQPEIRPRRRGLPELMVDRAVEAVGGEVDRP
jgi:hypothetical protein